MTVLAMLSWFSGLLFTLIIQIKKLFKLRAEGKKIRDILKTYPDRRATYQADIDRIKNDTKASYLTVIKCFGDLMPSSIGSGLSLLVSDKLNNFHAGLGGLISALISCYEIQKRIK